MAEVNVMEERLKQRPGLQAREVEGEMVVLDLASSQVHHLNGTAGFIWSQFDGTVSFEQVVETVCEQFAVDPQVAGRDVKEVAHRLVDIGLLATGPQKTNDQEGS